MSYNLLIDGHLVPGDLEFEVINPATEQRIAMSPAASPAQLDQAVAAANRAFPAWRATSLAQRQAVLSGMAEITRSHAEELAGLLSQEQGKPLEDARGELSACAGFFDYHASLAPSALTPSPLPSGRAQLLRDPLGVVGAIVPWNYPIALMAFKLPGALLMGNTVVLKPAPTTPLTTLRWAALVKDALPPGVLNVLGDAGDLGPLLTSHPGIRKISFTGSTATGRAVMRSAAATLKRLTLELGGNDPAIVLPDADPEAIATHIFRSAFQNNGQTCSAIKRVYVHESLHDRLTEALAAIADRTSVGAGSTPDVTLGPLQNKRQFDLVNELIEGARSTGRVVAGGVGLDGPGYFIRPTIVCDVADGSRIVDEEQFGPVLPIVRFTDLEAVVATVNASPYGLGASVLSSDRDAAREVALRIDAGSVWVNTHFPVSPDVPFGGARQSGMGVELGEQGLAEFSQLKVLVA
ncbi:aldehyde dehydrogenase family protein [Variovorax sp. EL159]|uniref:aldehyde dehydrogenase family protein n=1 Tax=Variovorax sp. EL159 TaxID=1566270 RepID=UPI000881FE51|nr:aldehyde dehydrogenase family protein [Variovorax sp. EL159]SCX72569.1 Acyl-CoA reductase [Variovorax sp. EL159]